MSGFGAMMVSSYIPQAAGGGDSDWTNVQILLRGGQSDGSTTIVDSSNNNYSFTTQGTAPTYSTTQTKWASTSIKFNNNGGKILEATSVSNLYLNTDFTIEFWVYLTSTSGALLGAGLFGRILIFPDLYCEMGNGSSLIGSSTASSGLSTNTWTHVAVTRSVNTVRVFKAGSQVSSYTVSGTPDTSKDIQIGCFNTGNYITGYMEDFRWTKGVARYTANFTPPTAQFPIG